MRGAYLCQLIDGRFDSLFLVLNQKEWFELEGVVNLTCENAFFMRFFPEDDEKTEETDRCFSSYEDVFAYCISKKLILVNGFSLIQY